MEKVMDTDYIWNKLFTLFWALFPSSRCVFLSHTASFLFLKGQGDIHPTYK